MLSDVDMTCTGLPPGGLSSGLSSGLSPRRQLCGGGGQAAIEKVLHFGRQLHAMSEQLKRDYGSNDTNKKVLRVGGGVGGVGGGL